MPKNDQILCSKCGKFPVLPRRDICYPCNAEKNRLQKVNANKKTIQEVCDHLENLTKEVVDALKSLKF